jgi:carboxyl-terminal processing protease
MDSFEEEAPSSTGRSGVVRTVLFACVVALAFGAGTLVGGQGSLSESVAKLPLIGDGLDATPDENASLDPFWKAWNVLSEQYVITHASSTLPSEKDRIYGAIQGLASAYGDPYTVFFPPEEAKEFAESISGSFAGVGMEIGIKDSILTVVAPLKGTPAENAGIQPGDQIVAIDDKPTDDVSVDSAVRQIRGPVGTTVKLSLIREGNFVEVDIVRDTIIVPETEDAFIGETGVYRIALYQFTSNSPRFFAEALARFNASGARALIVDLRGNPGGYLEVAVDMVSHFLPKGMPIVTEDFDGKAENVTHTSFGHTTLSKEISIVVLINNGSASASEIFAGALKDAERATIIGEQSFGKGSVQALIDLGGGSLKVTVARWVTPSGHWIMGNGITPDIEVGRTVDDLRAQKDPQLDRAVKFLTTVE